MDKINIEETHPIGQSAIVGMYAFLVEDREIKARAYIRAQAGEHYFIVQVISPFDGAPNVAKLMTLGDLEDWYIIPTQELANEIIEDYSKNQDFRYTSVLWS